MQCDCVYDCVTHMAGKNGRCVQCDCVIHMTGKDGQCVRCVQCRCVTHMTGKDRVCARIGYSLACPPPQVLEPL